MTAKTIVMWIAIGVAVAVLAGQVERKILPRFGL